MGDLFAPSHILLVIVFALLIFGPKKLPELGRSFGTTLRAFKEGVREHTTTAEASDEKRTVLVETTNNPKLPE